MKHYRAMLGIIFLAHCGSYLFAEPVVAKDTTAYTITIKSSGDDAVVNAIKEYSDITQADENRWGFSWVPVVGSSIRDGMIIKVRDYIRVCRGLRLGSSHYNQAQTCRAIDYLYQQGGRALALLGRFGTFGDQKLYSSALVTIIQKMEHHKKNMSNLCNLIGQQKAYQEQQEVEKERNKLKYNKNWWKIMALRWKMTKEIGTTAFNGAKWLIQTANEKSVPLLSVGAAWFVYNKLFGLPQQPAK